MVNDFFLFAQVCCVRLAGSQCLLAGITYAHGLQAAAAAYPDEIRVAGCVFLACCFSQSFWHGEFWDCFFHQDLLVLHVIKYYAVNMTDVQRKKNTAWHSTPEVSMPQHLTMSACSLVIINSHVDACQAQHFNLSSRVSKPGVCFSSLYVSKA